MSKIDFGNVEQGKKDKKDFSNVVSTYKQELDKHKEELEERVQNKSLSGIRQNANDSTHTRKTFFIKKNLNTILKVYCAENDIDQAVLINQLIHDWAVSVGRLKE